MLAYTAVIFLSLLTFVSSLCLRYTHRSDGSGSYSYNCEESENNHPPWVGVDNTGTGGQPKRNYGAPYAPKQDPALKRRLENEEREQYRQGSQRKQEQYEQIRTSGYRELAQKMHDAYIENSWFFKSLAWYFHNWQESIRYYTQKSYLPDYALNHDEERLLQFGSIRNTLQYNSDMTKESLQSSMDSRGLIDKLAIRSPVLKNIQLQTSPNEPEQRYTYNNDSIVISGQIIRDEINDLLILRYKHDANQWNQDKNSHSIAVQTYCDYLIETYLKVDSLHHAKIGFGDRIKLYVLQKRIEDLQMDPFRFMTAVKRELQRADQEMSIYRSSESYTKTKWDVYIQHQQDYSNAPERAELAWYKLAHLNVAYKDTETAIQNGDWEAAFVHLDRLWDAIFYARGFSNAVYDFAIDEAKGIVETIRHPLEALQGIHDLIVNHASVYEIVKQKIQSQIDSYGALSPEEKGRLHGRIGMEVFTTILPAGTIRYVGHGSKLRHVIENGVKEAFDLEKSAKKLGGYIHPPPVLKAFPDAQKAQKIKHQSQVEVS